MTSTITLTDEQLADLNAGKSVSQGITIDPPHQTPCQQRGLREGQWVWRELDEGTLTAGWVRLDRDDGTNVPDFYDPRKEDVTVGELRFIDWSRGIHDEKPVEKWEPKGGEFTADVEEGGVSSLAFKSTRDCANAGLERDRHDHADRAAKKLRQYSRLQAWVDEHCPDYVEPAMSVAVSSVRWNWQAREWEAFIMHDRALLAVTMPEWAAQQLAHDLNTGKVEL